MGDGPEFSTGNNRPSALSNFGRTKMLEWRPRFIFLVLFLVLIAFSLGFSSEDLHLDNWEW
jgi:hypothetical protein